MKKTAFTVVTFVVLAAVLLVFLQQQTTRTMHASGIAPAGTILFFHLPDVQRSQLRWPQTALARIGAESEVQAFLEKPRSKAPEMKEADAALAHLQRARIGEAFVALTDVDDSKVKFVAGVSYTGPDADVDAVIEPLRAELRKAPFIAENGLAVESGRVRHGNEIGWLLVSNDADTLKTALARVNGKADETAKSLEQNGQFTVALAAVPKEADFEIFADAEAIARRVLPLVAASGTPVPAEAQEMIKKAKGLAYSLKMDGGQFREAAFMAGPGVEQSQLALHMLAATSAATAVVLSNALPPASEQSASALSMLALIPGFTDLEKALSAAGLKLEDLGAVFGPEVGAVLDWPAESTAPSFALTLDLRDAAKAKAVASALTAGTDTWEKSDHAGAAVFSQKADALFGIVKPTIALGEKFAVFGLSTAGVNDVLDRAAAPHEQIDASPAYFEATKLMTKPTSSFAFIDLKTLFERIYGTVRPLALLALALQPEVSQYIDAGKLPKVETIAQHLSPMAYSTSVTNRGILMESSGPMTASQMALLFGGAAAGVISSGEIKPGGMLDPGALGLPSIPGLTPPSPKSAIPTLPTLPDPPDPKPKPEENPAEKPQ